MQAPISATAPQEYWNQTLERIANEFDVIADQLHDATTTYPELVGSFGLLLAFTAYRHDTESDSPFAASLESLSTKMFVRSSYTHQCMKGNLRACEFIGQGHPGDGGPEPTECHQLYQTYLAKRREERDALKGSPWDGNDSIKLHNTIQESEAILSQLRDMGCPQLHPLIPSFIGSRLDDN